MNTVFQTTLRLMGVTAALAIGLTSSASADKPAWSLFFKPLPEVAANESNPVTPEKVALGKKLYHETRLSKDGDISCNSCHDLENYGVDGKSTSPGHKGQLGDRNSPTVYNAALHFAQFWDGRAKDVEEQALGPILNPVEMAVASEEEAVNAIKDDPDYRKLFAAAFPDEQSPITFNNIGKAIGAFERTLLTPGRFDQFLSGKQDALTSEEQKGLETFQSSGCVTCHNGATIGGNMYQKLGLVVPYETKDTGRHKVTGNDAEKYFFKVPSLRNIEKTAPYFHDGSVKTLDEAVRLMAKHQLGKELADTQIREIVTFLKALTAELPASR